MFHDDIGELSALRDRLSLYPDDVWRYVLAPPRRTLRESWVGVIVEVQDPVHLGGEIGGGAGLPGLRVLP
ncbi:DUF4037 domain-containing protein [Micromonospora sp. NBC_01412]|uniref:DUF4037 domain-containing protein n=1 Tax=Micromonospora sp. NBC_01412 TaxID=2903590 RepID=UPI00324BD3B1